MLVSFRVDASIQIGSGHVMRCLTLADALSQDGYQCQFICRELKGHLGDLIASRGYNLSLLPPPIENHNCEIASNSVDYKTWLGVTWQDDADQTLDCLKSFIPDLLVVDHYALDYKWENQLSSHVKNVFVIDDLANREHKCNLLLDQNLGRCSYDYERFVSADSKLLIGPKFALLRAEFVISRDKCLVRRQNPVFKRILISLGGIDKANITCQILEVIAEFFPRKNLKLDIVMGRESPYLEEVYHVVRQFSLDATISSNVSNMAERMFYADLSIGAAGGTSWERCCLGLPSIIFVLADNQREGASALRNVGAAIVIWKSTEFKIDLLNALKTLSNPTKLKLLSQNAASISDGRGCERVLEEINDMLGRVNE